jgi:hypothetical protein
VPNVLEVAVSGDPLLPRCAAVRGSGSTQEVLMATSTEPTAPVQRALKVPVPTPLPFAESVPADVLQQIVFGSRIARSVAITDPYELPALTAKRIWSNIECYLATGDWLDRRRSAAEIDAEELMAMTPQARNRAIKALRAVSDVT